MRDKGYEESFCTTSVQMIEIEGKRDVKDMPQRDMYRKLYVVCKGDSAVRLGREEIAA